MRKPSLMQADRASRRRFMGTDVAASLAAGAMVHSSATATDLYQDKCLQLPKSLDRHADSSLAGVMGRLAAYTGKRVGWEFLAKESTLDLFPPNLSWDGPIPAPQPAVPGRTPLV